MSVSYYMIGDTIINAGDKNSDVFILLDGEVRVVNIEGRKVVAVVRKGQIFGEANCLFNWTFRRTASVICTTTC